MIIGPKRIDGLDDLLEILSGESMKGVWGLALHPDAVRCVQQSEEIQRVWITPAEPGDPEFEVMGVRIFKAWAPGIARNEVRILSEPSDFKLRAFSDDELISELQRRLKKKGN